ISRTSSVQAIAKTPSLNASIRCSSLCEFIRLDAYSEVSKTRRAHKYRRGPIEIGEELLQRFDLWEIVDHDVRVSRILLKKVLVVVLGSEEGTVRLDFRDDWSPEHLSMIQLRDVCTGHLLLFGAGRKDRRAVLRPFIGSLTVQLCRIMHH